MLTLVKILKNLVVFLDLYNYYSILYLLYNRWPCSKLHEFSAMLKELIEGMLSNINNIYLKNY